jgi:hypothetical protein
VELCIKILKLPLKLKLPKLNFYPKLLFFKIVRSAGPSPKCQVPPLTGSNFFYFVRPNLFILAQIYKISFFLKKKNTKRKRKEKKTSKEGKDQGRYRPPLPHILQTHDVFWD